MKIGIIGAMHEEVAMLLQEIKLEKTTELGKRIFYEGELYGVAVVLVFSRWGKVAAASTATQLITEFGVRKIVFTGIAGGIAPELKIGDIVIGQRFFQHDMDASPLMPKYEIPLIGRKHFESNANDILQAKAAAERFIEKETAYFSKLSELGIEQVRIHIGDIASGDLFVSSEAQKESILKGIPSALCVEMEGAAVAQVCFDFDIPLLVIRSISDTADHKAELDFTIFLKQVASEYAHYILKELLPRF